MKYDNILPGVFIQRYNRFVAGVEIQGKEELCHVKNTGRCKELFLPGASVFVQKAAKQDRKTKYDLVSVYKGRRLVNVDSQAPNKVAVEYLPRLVPGVKFTRSEVKYGGSRFDVYLETDAAKMFVEVKGVTLEVDGVAMFPDAPTERGLRHLQELARAVGEGYKAMMLFVVQMEGVRHFSPNSKTHQAFAEGLKTAQNQGVLVKAVDCLVTKTSLEALTPVEVILT